MPTYVYACDACGAQFEQFQSFKDDPLRDCPSCAGAVRRVFQPVGIVFKGSGWYITDSRKAGSATSTSDDTPATPEAKAETKAESTPSSDAGAKPAPASETKSSSESTAAKA